MYLEFTVSLSQKVVNINVHVNGIFDNFIEKEI